jgi:hypothetical protein
VNAEQIKYEIRKLSRIDKIEIHRWIDEDAATDLILVSDWHEIEQKRIEVTRKHLRHAPMIQTRDARTDHLLESESVAARDWYAYQGPLGQVVHNGTYFFASKDEFLIGTYNTLEEAMESLAWRERLKSR